MNITLDVNLNKKQLDAVETIEGYVCVIAAAGSGKTKALCNRYYQLLNEGIIPGHVLCITFTNKAAVNMRTRIKKKTGDRSGACITTFHGLCNKILKEDIVAMGYSPKFSIADTSDTDRYLRNVYKERGLSAADLKKSKAKEFIAGWKGKNTEECAKALFTLTTEEVEKKYKQSRSIEMKVLYGYLYYQKKYDSLDFNDLINFTLLMFDKMPQVKKKWQDAFDYIMVDEFQDVDGRQNELVELLSKTSGNLFVVGDPDQTIYTWRNADFHYLKNFASRHPGAKVINMLENYRSTSHIIKVANALISHNADRIRKDIIPTKKGSKKVIGTYEADDYQEADWIATEIANIHKKLGYAYKDIAILVRNNDQTRVIEQALISHEIPYAVIAAKAFFEREEVRVILGYFRMIYNNDDRAAFERVINVPSRRFGDAKIDRLNKLADVAKTSLYETLKNNLEDEKIKKSSAKEFVDVIDELSKSYKTRTLTELLSDVLSKTGYESEIIGTGEDDRIANITEMKRMIAEFEEYYEEDATLENYLDHISLLTKYDDSDDDNKVQMMTIHAAKGLEFSAVFMAGMIEGLIPSYRVKSAEGIEEERRIAFVGITRAEERLYLSCNGGNHQEGSSVVTSEPSRFMYEIDPGLIDFKKKLPPDGYKYIDDDEEEFEEIVMAEAGDIVIHDKFGEGKVKKVTTEGYQIDFEGRIRNLSFDAPITIR